MFVKRRSRWTVKSKNRIGQRSIAGHSKCSCAPPSENQDESVASKNETGADILKQTSYSKLLQAAMLLLDDYCSNSTLHGVRYFVDKKRHWLERFWWIAGFVMSIICCGALIHKVYDNWDQRSIIVSISEELTPVWDIPLPAVTICPTNKIQSKQSNFNTERFLLLEQPELVNITDEEVEMVLVFATICAPSRDLTNISDKFRKNSYIDLVWKLAPSLNYTVRSCSLPGYPNFQCELKEIMTAWGLCFTFNMLNGKETYSTESTAYSQMNHNKAAQWNLENGYDSNISKNSRAYPYRVSGSVDEGDALIISLYVTRKHNIGCRREAFDIALHIPGEIPHQYLYKLDSFQDTYITVKPKVIKTSDELRHYHPDRRKCYFNADRQLRFLKIYTQRNCELECLSNFTLSLCGCVRHSMLSDANTPICGPAKHHCYTHTQEILANGQIKRGLNITEEEYIKLRKLVENCNCLPPCNSLKYDYEVRKYERPNKDDIDKPSFLNIAFEESEFITLIRSEVYGTIDFIANCGGLLGLFVGASFLSVVEMLYYCSLRLLCTRLNRKRKNKMAYLTV